MIANELKVEIGRYADGARVSNPLFRAAATGALTPASAANYLASLLTLVRHTPVYLARARRCALARGQTRLADHFAEKLGEEDGHDAWGESDLRELAARFGLAAPAEAVPAVRGLLGFIEETIDREPIHYLAYILFVEHVTVLVGPEFLANAEQRCGIPRSALSVIGNHVVLDVNHVEEGLTAIDSLVGPDQLGAMLDVMRATMGWFDRLCAEAAGPARDEASAGDTARAAV